MATVREELKKLPLQKRLQAIENIRKQNIMVCGLKKALDDEYSNGNFLISYFSFTDTRQGLDYWFDIYGQYCNLKQ
jgi:hypothetical protein